MHGAKWVHGHATDGAMEAAQRDVLREKHRRFPGRYTVTEPRIVTTPMTAHVNHGRWLIDCPCGNGVAVETGWPGRCFSCGSVYPSIVYPAERTAIEAALSGRPEVNQHWCPGETVADLRRENREHDVRTAQ